MTTLPQLIANAVETDPAGTALVLADGTGPLEQVSYADLDAWSSRLARALIERGIGPEDLVAVAVPRSLDAVLAVWAVAKTGAGFVPIDPAYPPEWVAHLLVDSGAVFGLAVSWVRTELPDEIEWLRVDTVDTARSLELLSADPVTYADRVRPLRAEHPAYVSYVSDGETLPDGVVVTQAGLAGLCADQQGRYRVESEDRTLNFAPMPSDSAVLELLLALGGAATMVVVSPLVSDAHELTELLRRTGVTHAYLPADVLPLIDPAGLDELGIVVTGRRPCPPELLSAWAVPVGEGGRRVLYQGYGPPETTVMTCISSPLTGAEPPTLGTPIRGVVARVLDENLAPVADGVVGELYLGGPPLARGYHRRPGRTAQLLIADPCTEDGSRLYRTGDLVRRSHAAGDLEFVGRIELTPPAAAPPEPQAAAAVDPDEVVVPDSRPVEPLPDYPQSLPVRDLAPEPAAALPDPVRTEYDTDVPAPFGLDPGYDPQPHAAAVRGDLELPGRGHQEMPDRQQDLYSGHPDDAMAFYENPLSARSAAAPEQEGPEPSAPVRMDPVRPVPPPLPARPAISESGAGPLWPAPDTPPPVSPEIAAPPVGPQRPEPIPLSPAQQRFWERNQGAPEAGADTVTAAMRLTGTLDATALQAAVADVVDRHETLRTVYPASGDIPHQVVLPRELTVPEVVAEPVPAAQLRQWLQLLAHTDFDTADPEQVPVRFALAELSPREHVVAVVVHRILADESSAELLLRDLLRAFLGRRNRSRPLWQPLAVQYLDHFLGRRSALGEITDPQSPATRRLAYWRDQLADLPPRLALPIEGRRPDGGDPVQAHTVDIDPVTHRRIGEIADRTGASEFVVLRTALAVLLARSVAVDDIVLGTSVRGTGDELGDAIGPYADPVVLRTRVDPVESFCDLVRRVAESDRAAFVHADLPFETLVTALQLEPPLFDVTIAPRYRHIPRLDMPSLSTEPVETPLPDSGETLRLIVDPQSSADGSPAGIGAAFHFAADRIGAATVAEYARRFQQILTVAGGDPDIAIGRIDLLSPADLERLLVVWNDTQYPVPPELLLDGYRRTVAVRPDTVAVTDAESELTYRQFDARVNQLARRLIEAGVGAEIPVGVAVRYSPDLVVAIYAVLTAGGAYLPVEPIDPPRWNAQLLDIVAPGVILVDRAGAARLTASLQATGQPTPVLVIDDDELSIYSAEPVTPEELLRPVRPDNVAAVLCASLGADGPEPAVLTHGVLNNQITLLLGQSPLGFTDIYLQRTRASYDTSLWGFFLPLRAGAQLVLADPARSGNPARVAESIAAHGVTVADFGPTQLAGFADLVDPDRMGSLREIFVTGGSLASEVVSALRLRSAARIHNMYGTCETAVSATVWPAAGSTEASVPIGLPQWNTRVYVLDARLRPVPPGIPGELYLAGDQLARGYARREAATVERFVASPFGTGQRMYRTGDVVVWREATADTPHRLDLLGRTDDQLRFRGQRVRPGILAALLGTLPEVADAAVVARSSAPAADTPAGARLVAYVVPAQDEPDLSRIRTELARMLPADLVPAGFQVVGEIPVHSDGTPGTDLLPDADDVPLLDPLPEPVVPDEELIAPGDPADIVSPAPDFGGVPAREDVEVTGAPAATAPKSGGAETISTAGPSGAEFSGELPATATVVRLLDNPHPGVEIRSIVLDLPPGEAPERTEEVVRALMLRHPMLWARLDSSGDSPVLWIPPRDRRGDRQFWWRGPEAGENTAATDDVVQAAADALDPATGRNIHFVTTGADSARRLVIVANGAVVDDRSWRVLIDELRTGDAAVSVPEARVSQLAQASDQRARSIDLLDEAGWWRRNLAGARSAPPLGAADLRARRRVSLAITAEGTAAVTAAADAYRATVSEVLLTAFAIALRTGAQDTVARSLGSLVRCDADERSLVNRGDTVVGGFVTEYPLSVQLTDIDTADALVGGPAAGRALTQIRDLVRSVPGGGTGYALLRYLNPETTAEFAAADSGRFTLRYRDLRPARVHTDGPADGVPLALTVDVTDDGLISRFDYATEVFVGDDVKTFAEHWVRALGGLAEHGLRPNVGDPDPPAGAPDEDRQPLPGTVGSAGSRTTDSPVAGPAAESSPGPETRRRPTAAAADAPVGRTSLNQAQDSASEVSTPESSPGGGLPGPARPGARPMEQSSGTGPPPRMPGAGAPSDAGRPPRPVPSTRDTGPDSPLGRNVGAEMGLSGANPVDPSSGSAGPTSTDLPGAVGMPSAPRLLPGRPVEPGTGGANSPISEDIAGSAADRDDRLPGPAVTGEAAGVGGSEPESYALSSEADARDSAVDIGLPEAEHAQPHPWDDPIPDAVTTSLLRPVTAQPEPQRTESAGLPQRRPREDREPADHSAPRGFPQRDPGPNSGSYPEPQPGSGLPQRRPTSPDPDALPGVPRAVPAVPDALPQRRPSMSEVGESVVESPGVPGVLPQRDPRPSSDSGGPATDPGAHGPMPPGPGLPRRRPSVPDRGAGDESSAAAASGLPQRRSLTSDAEGSAGPDLGGTASRSTDEPGQSGPEENAVSPLAGLVAPTVEPPGAPQPRYRPGGQSPDTDADDFAPSGELPRRGFRSAPDARPAESAPLPHRRGPSPGSSPEPEPTTFLRPVTDGETTAYLSPIHDSGSPDDATTLLSLFDEQIARTPDDPAVRQGARLLSYAELDRKSRALSVELIRFGVGAQTPVAVAMRPGIDLVVAVCAVLRAGGAYIALDPGSQAGELDRILASAAPICVLSTSDDAVITGTGIPVVAMDLLYLDLPADPAADPVVLADDIADIRYFPDTRLGVTTTHRQLVERLRRAQRSHPYDAADLVLHAAPTVAEITLWELFRPLNSGAQILMPDHPGRAADLSRSIAAHKVTIVHVVPALLDRFLDSVTDGGGRSAHPSLHRVVVDGAALPAGGVERFLAVLPRAELVIWYGHNETGVITVGSVGGRPVTNDRVYLLDEQLRPAASGAAGEMYIGGPQLARGFYDEPGTTATRFVATAGGGRLYRTGDIVRRREGVLEYLGRVEHLGGSLTVGS